MKLNLIPDSIIEDSELRNDWQGKYAKHNAFARLFGINPDKPADPGDFRGDDLTKGETIDRLVEGGIVTQDIIGKGKAELILLSRFQNDYGSWYRFERVQNPQRETRYRLIWETDMV